MTNKITIKIFKEKNPKPLPSGYRYVLKKGKSEIFHSNLFETKKQARFEALRNKQNFEEY